MKTIRWFALVPALAVLLVAQPAAAAEPGEAGQRAVAEPAPMEPKPLPPPKNAKPMPKPDLVWVDMKGKRVLVDGYVSLREGYLEMFACLEGTKEHESIVAVRSRAQVVHAALLSIGAKTGTPVRFMPEFKPPTGDRIDVTVEWLDESGKMQSVPAQDWVVDADTDKPLSAPWVFAGSGFWTEESSGKRYYMAEVGDFICVSNFSTAMLDVTIESTSAAEGLLFKANTEAIPPLGTPVRLILSIHKEDAKEKRDQKD